MKNTNTDNFNQYEPDLDCLQYYEIDIGRIWTPYEYWSYAEHLILCMNESNDFYVDFDDFFKEVIDNDPPPNDGLDLGDAECITEEDMFRNTWLVAGMEFPNFIDYFWEAEITSFCQNKDRDFYTEYRDGFSEHKDDQFSKYRCYQGDSWFYFCNRESCEGCSHGYTEKAINAQYILWEKYVQPLGLD